jgi:hypothetical protein
LTVWVSVAVLLATTLSSQVIESEDEIRMPSRLDVRFELFVMVLPVISLRSPLLRLTPS